MTVNELLEQLQKIDASQRHKPVVMSINIYNRNFDIHHVTLLGLILREFNHSGDEKIAEEMKNNFSAVSLYCEVSPEEQKLYEKREKDRCEFERDLQLWKNFCKGVV